MNRASGPMRDGGQSRAGQARAQRGDRILVVDDEPASLHLLAHLLSGTGYEVTTAVDGTDAWDILRTEPISLLVLDLRMPGMNGWELLRRVRCRFPEGIVPEERLAAVKVCVVSGKTDEPTRAFVERLGADCFVPKPVHPEALRSAVAHLLHAPPSRAAPRPSGAGPASSLAPP